MSEGDYFPKPASHVHEHKDAQLLTQFLGHESSYVMTTRNETHLITSKLLACGCYIVADALALLG